MKKRWQNLIHEKCPNCDNRLVKIKEGYACSDALCTFFITPKKIAEIITDPNHPAVRYMTEHEIEVRNKALRDMGVVV